MPPTPAAPPAKISSAEIFARLDAIRDQVTAVVRTSQLALFSPEAMYVYKPRQDGSGAALKLDLRLTPSFNEKGFVHKVEGGLYLELAAQTGKGEDGYARFGWQEDSRLTAKLGIPDISAILLALRTVRIIGKKVPEAIRAKNDTEGTTVGLFHKFEKDTTAIDLKFAADGSFIRVSKSKDWHRSIKLTLSEEIVVEAYLQKALQAFLAAGA